jgi:hypothetical protein
MTCRLLVGIAVAATAAFAGACSSDTPAQVTLPSSTTTSSAGSSAVSVGSFTGLWTLNGADGVPSAVPDNTAVSLVANGVCQQLELKVDRNPDSRTATIVFAATCANARIRGQGAGQMSDGVLLWRAEGTVALASGRTCPFKFVEGNRAVLVAEGQVQVTYNGTVCEIPVSGTQVLTRR